MPRALPYLACAPAAPRPGPLAAGPLARLASRLGRPGGRGNFAPPECPRGSRTGADRARQPGPTLGWFLPSLTVGASAPVTNRR